MSNEQDLLASFTSSPFTSSPRQTKESCAIVVENYVVSSQGDRKTNRVIGHRVDTGEKVEVYLSAPPKNVNDRKEIHSFQYDGEHNNMGVTTAAGGILAIEKFRDVTSSEQRVADGQKILEANWITRISAGRGQGYAFKASARVNAPRLKNASDPQKGYYQNVSILGQNSFEITDVDKLDKAIIYSLNPLGRDAETTKRGVNTRPGRLTAYIRLSNETSSELMEFRGNFHKPDGINSEPKPVEMVCSDLLDNEFWQTKRAVLVKAIASPLYKVEVIPGSTLSVGFKSMEKIIAGKTCNVMGMSASNNEDSETPLFSDCVIGVRITPTTGRESLIYTKMALMPQRGSRTGLVHEATDKQPEPQQKPQKAAAPAQQPQQPQQPQQDFTPAQSQQAPIPQQYSQAEPPQYPEESIPQYELEPTPHPQDVQSGWENSAPRQNVQAPAPQYHNFNLEVQQTSEQQFLSISSPNSNFNAEAMKILAKTLGGRITGNKVFIDASRLPQTIEKLNQNNYQYSIPTPEENPVVANNVQSTPPITHAPPLQYQEPQQASSAQQEPNMNHLDLDNALDDIFNIPNKPGHQQQL